MRWIRRLALAALALCGCSFSVDYGGSGYACPNHGPCPNGFTCENDECVPSAAPDAGGPGAPDARVDAGMVLASCGDGTVQAGEDCDDGNQDDSDGCLHTCAWARCGDGAVRAGVEACDDSNTDDGDACSSRCLACSGADAYAWPKNGHCYRVGASTQTFANALAGCFDAGNYLATIVDADEDNGIAGPLALGNRAVWIGLVGISGNGTGNFVWVDGEPLVGTKWGPGEPNGSGPGVRRDKDSLWYDSSSANTFRALCEQDPWTLRPLDNHAYRLIAAPLTSAQAETACAALGAHPAVLKLNGLGAAAFMASVVHAQSWLAPMGNACVSIAPGPSVTTPPCDMQLPALCEID